MTGLDCIHTERFVTVCRLNINFFSTIVLASSSTGILDLGRERKKEVPVYIDLFKIK